MYHYEEVKLEELQFDGSLLQYPCPCGDLFEMELQSLLDGSDVAQCPTCSLTIKVLYSAEERDAFLAKHGVSTTAGTRPTELVVA